MNVKDSNRKVASQYNLTNGVNKSGIRKDPLVLSCDKVFVKFRITISGQRSKCSLAIKHRQNDAVARGIDRVEESSWRQNSHLKQWPLRDLPHHVYDWSVELRLYFTVKLGTVRQEIDTSDCLRRR
ncbi:hypothetical protein HUJ05_010289 [Dendroctonus ponderosae]|nr:hypothetical protein HUJ05_010289 [Dendroctonus ponderosae]